jgi:methylenetetrahydrofolate reductase (NADPH)
VAKANIKVSTMAGIMAITDVEKIKTFSKRCCAEVSDNIIHRFEKVSPMTEEAKKVGIEIATEQRVDLLEQGLHYFHFYTLNQSDAVFQVASNLDLQNLGAKGSGGLIKSE